MDLLIGLIAGILVFLVFRKNGDSKDAVTHATTDARLEERQRNREEESRKMDEDLKKIEEEMKHMTPEEIEKYWDKK